MLSRFSLHSKKESLRKKFKIDKNDLLIVVTARIENLKGQKYLIEACRKLRNKIKSFHILLAGEIVDFSYLIKCQKIAKESGINERVIFLGNLDDVNQLLYEADICVLPSLFEAFPRAVIEAMAFGKPIIATDVGGCSEAFENGISGFLVPPKNSDALADKILLLAKSKNLRKKIGTAGRCKVEKEFAIKDKVKQIERLYYEVL